MGGRAAGQWRSHPYYLATGGRRPSRGSARTPSTTKLLLRRADPPASFAPRDTRGLMRRRSLEVEPTRASRANQAQSSRPSARAAKSAGLESTAPTARIVPTATPVQSQCAARTLLPTGRQQRPMRPPESPRCHARATKLSICAHSTAGMARVGIQRTAYFRTGHQRASMPHRHAASVAAGGLPRGRPSA